ncbi:SDR family NAD(P)-dependent oxidoreductase [Jejuia pallidilutea]|uniref:3-oxoacyl-[acyl-carrier protein] reductase n=1 Tax=Jejuia pallidilutea TaxID=504487 RepID=A0A090WSR2_9FLAO|nr:SDR family oxidoreductase [Jejuia pallidilutea]GAL66776.1 3-oxoacyl-[acyl-carrier protein] reductase [Jejuia pallidilutea]GAL70437.1 3-oxoacyl-[acyl-carrier protein] reductase [Jejuia pallidilutea]GAL90505.1 3-oxoacyl-[acyl-carrier protein] reductase [Jejuia pallidilutea]
MKRLNKKTAIITGGSGSIGKTTAAKFLEQGANVVLVDLNQEALEEAQKELNAGDRVIIVKADVTSADDTKNFVQKALDAYGKIDIVFANAGIEGKVAPIIDFDDKVFDTVMAVNIKGVYLSIKHSIAALRDAGGGSIIISSSVTGLQGVPNAVAYSTSKHATVGLTKSAAMDLAKYKIRVNCINPSPVDNRMMQSLEEGFAPGDAEAAHARLTSQIPLGRYAEPHEVADLVLFLASDESKFITGTTNPIDGGMLA